MRIRTILAGGILALSLIASPLATVQAAEYGSAGCGLGSMAVKKTNWLQIFATTLNGLFSNQTFAISSGTSGCDAGTLGDAVNTSRKFVETNREVIAKEIAQGGGETVASLATIAGCSNAGAVGGSLQENFQTIFTSADLSDSEVGQRVVGHLQADASLSCTL